MASRRSQFREKTSAFLAEPEAIDDICDAISDGMSLASFTSENSLKYRMVYDFIHDNETRKAKYEAAVKARNGKQSDEMLDQLVTASKIDPRTAFNTDGSLKPITEMPDEIAGSITGFDVSVTEEGKVSHRMKFTPRHTAVETLAKHLGFTKERVEMTGANGTPLTGESAMSNEVARRILFLLNNGKKAGEGAPQET